MKLEKYWDSPFPKRWIRPAALGLLIFFSLLGAFALWVFYDMLFPIYGRMWRYAPVVETPFLAFPLISGIAIVPMILVISTYVLIYGRQLGRGSPDAWLNAVRKLLKTGIFMLVIVAPLLSIGTAITLKAMGYWSCSQLRISGSAWQVFWVNTEAACFKPDHYINDNWPCKKLGDKTICLQADGRDKASAHE